MKEEKKRNEEPPGSIPIVYLRGPLLFHRVLFKEPTSSSQRRTYARKLKLKFLLENFIVQFNRHRTVGIGLGLERNP